MKKVLFTATTALLLMSCSTGQSLYSWYNYEDATYQFSKKQTDELKEKMMQQYLKMSESQKGIRRVVPPGFNAEYGYALYMSEKKEEGLNLLREEIRLYPESETYISRIIKQLEK